MLEAIILAGGLGTRLKDVVPHLPKPMAPVNGKPFLSYILNMLSEKNFKKITLSVGYKSEEIVEYFGDRFGGMELLYVKESSPLGTGGGVRSAMQNCFEDHVYVINGDTYLDFEIDEIEKLWGKNHNPIIVGIEVENTSRYGMLNIQSGEVKSFKEKQLSKKGIINAGCYVFKRNQLEKYPFDFAFSLERDYLAKEVKNQVFDCFVSKKSFIDIGIPDDYMKASSVVI